MGGEKGTLLCREHNLPADPHPIRLGESHGTPLRIAATPTSPHPSGSQHPPPSPNPQDRSTPHRHPPTLPSSGKMTWLITMLRQSISNRASSCVGCRWAGVVDGGAGQAKARGKSPHAEGGPAASGRNY